MNIYEFFKQIFNILLNINSLKNLFDTNVRRNRTPYIKKI